MRHRTSPTRARHRLRPTLIAVTALALVLVACSSDDGTTDETPADDASEEEAIGELDDLDDAGGSDDTDSSDDTDADPPADLEDPNELVVDGTLAANGVILPVPEGWRFDELAFANGFALAVAPDSEQQVGAEAVDPAGFEEEVTFDSVLEANRTNVEVAADVDEEVDLPGAERAVQLRYLDIPSSPDAPDGQPESTSVLLIVAERADGVLAVFSYAAASEAFDDAIAGQLLATAAFDPDSDPARPPQQPIG